jgi:hypothetical protein
MAGIKRTALVIEHGLFQPLAHRLAKDYERVLYFRPWVSSLPHPNNFYVGTGYEDIERVESYEQYFDDESVTWIFPDLHFAELQKWLRSKNRPVWGAGDGEELELMRGETKDLMEKVGLPVKPWARVVGLDALHELLEKQENVFVKISKLRGLTETFCSPNYELVKPKLDSLRDELGGRSEVQEFIVEKPVEDAIEVGYDGVCVDGAFPQTALMGVEIKNAAYMGRVMPYAGLPKQVLEVNRKLAPEMKAKSYRGFFSTEIRVGKDNKPYLIDLTCRHASPAGEAILEVASNISEMIEAGAHGKLIDIKPNGKFVAQAMLHSDFAKKNWVPIEIPEAVRPHVHLYNSCRVDEVEYVIPMGDDDTHIGSVTAAGATAEEAMKLCQKYISQIEAFGLKDDADKLPEAIEDLKKA